MAASSSKIVRLSTQRDNKNRNVHRVTYLVEGDDRTEEGAAIILSAQSASPHAVPNMWARYSLFGTTDLNSFVQSINANRENVDSPLWTIEVEYKPLEPGQKSEPEGGYSNPLARPTEYWLENETFTEVAKVDKDGDPIENAAGQPYIDPIEVANSRTILAARKNLASLDQILDLQVTYQGRVNSDTYRSQAARRWLVREISAGQQQEENGIKYYEVTYRIVLKEAGETWDEKRENKGLMSLVGGVAKPIIRDGLQVIEPVDLTATGTVASPAAATIVNTHSVIKEVSFANIGV